MTTPDTRNGVSSNQPDAVRPSRTRSSPHPRYSLQQAEQLAEKALESGARHCDQDAMAQKIGYKNASNGAFKGLRAAANYFGIITYQDDHYLSVTEPWIDALHREDRAALSALRRKAVQGPELYRQLIDEFKDKQLPSVEKLARQLILQPRYGILGDAAETAARVFLESIKRAGLVDDNGFLRLTATPPLADSRGAEQATSGTDTQRNDPQSQRTMEVATSVGTPVGPASMEGLDRIEVQLAGGRRAYFNLPVPLSSKEKERLKKYIDLILEPEVETPGISGN